MLRNLLLTGSLLTAAFCATADAALAQGCINSRHTTGAYGSDGPYLAPGKLVFNQSARYLKADKHFVGTMELKGLNATGSNAINEQHVLDFGFTYGVSESLSVSLSIPYSFGTWSLPLPMGPPMMPGTKGPRYKQAAEGVGDLTLTARHWLHAPSTSPDHNIQFGFGIKAPTGESNATSLFGNINGGGIRQRSVDASIQPGDGGWGMVFDFFSFYKTKYCDLFVDGGYMMNPEESNDAVSTPANLFGELNVPADIRFNSIPDRFLFRIGAAREIASVPGLVPQISWRIEGIPDTDILGGEDGYRQTGYATYIEPGVSYSYGNASWSVSVPYALIRNRETDAGGRAGDATFADWMLLIGVSFDVF